MGWKFKMVFGIVTCTLQKVKLTLTGSMGCKAWMSQTGRHFEININATPFVTTKGLHKVVCQQHNQICMAVLSNKINMCKITLQIYNIRRKFNNRTLTSSSRCDDYLQRLLQAHIKLLSSHRWFNTIWWLFVKWIPVCDFFFL